jgi:ribosome assembly protein 4
MGTMIRNLMGHAHWVNHLALSSDFILRTGPYDHTDTKYNSKDEAYQKSLFRYQEFIKKNGKERLASGSDDFTMFLWENGAKKPLARMTGHHQPVNHLSFSPDGNILASASFDKSVKLWDGKTAKYNLN